MKQITLDYETYEKELVSCLERGGISAMHAVVRALKENKAIKDIQCDSEAVRKLINELHELITGEQVEDDTDKE